MKIKTLIFLLFAFTLVGPVTSQNRLDANSEVYCQDQLHCTLRLYLGPVNYLDNGTYKPINATITQSPDPIYNHAVTKGLYSAYFKSNPAQGQAVKVVKDNTTVHFQPMTLNYRNRLDQLQQIRMVQAVSGVPSNSYFYYPDAYGPGLTLGYEYRNMMLKEGLIIRARQDLPEPQGYMISGGNLTLDLDFILESGNRIFIEGVEWDKSTTAQTSNEVQIKDSLGNTVYVFSKPYAIDSNGNKTGITYQFKKSSNKLYIILKTPYEWLNNPSRVYPVAIDPTITLQDPETENREDTFGYDPGTTFDPIDYGSCSYLQLCGVQYNAILKFNISGVPAGKNVTDAKLYLYMYENEVSTNQHFNLSLARVSPYPQYSIGGGEWTEGNECDGTSTSSEYAIEYSPSGSLQQRNNQTLQIYGSTSLGWLVMNSSELFMESYRNSESNITLLVFPTAQSTNDNNFDCRDDQASRDDIRIYSKEAGSNTPYLEVTYQNWDAPVVQTMNNLSESLSKPHHAQINITVTNADSQETNLSIIWYRNGTTIYNQTLTSIELGTTLSLNLSPGNFSKNDRINASIYAFDAYNISSTVQTNTVTIQNAPPTLENVTISPSPAQATDNLNCTYPYYDYDGDLIGSSEFRWYNNSVLYPVTAQVLGKGNLTTGEKWKCSVRVNDSTTFTSWVNSSEITLGDTSGPIVENVSIPTSAEQNAQQTLTLDCYDIASSIGYVRINITNPDLQKATYSYSYISGYSYRLYFTPTIPGAYSFDGLICMDTSGNANISNAGYNMVVSAAPGENNQGGGGGGGSVIIDKTDKTIIIDWGVLQWDKPVFYTPLKIRDRIIIKNEGNKDFYGKFSVSDNLKPFISAKICTENEKNCVNSGVSLKAGESKLLVIDGMVYALNNSEEGYFRLESTKSNEGIFELEARVARVPGHKLQVWVSEKLGLGEQESAILTYIMMPLLVLVLFYEFILGG